VHLVTPRKRLPLRQSIYFDAIDQRQIFAIPRDEAVYIGTTDTNYHNDLDHPHTTREDASYLLQAVNRLFPKARLTLDDVTSSWAGLRPLIHEAGKAPSELSRKDEMFIAPSGLLSIAGGKLTGFRKMAQRTVDLVVKKRQPGRSLRECHTAQITLTGGNLDPENIPNYVQRLQHDYASITAATVEKLFYRYGTEACAVLAAGQRANAPDPEKALLKAELQYCIENEMTVTLSDFLIRRTGMLHFERDRIAPLLPWLLDEMAQLLHWNPAQKAANRKQWLEAYHSAVAFKGTEKPRLKRVSGAAMDKTEQ